MRVQVVDPAAYTPPYDHALAGALARAGAEVELVTCRFPYGPVPARAGLRGDEFFYRRSSRAGDRRPPAPRCGRPSTCPDMLRYRRHARGGRRRPLPVAARSRARPAAARPRRTRASSRCTGASPSPAAASRGTLRGCSRDGRRRRPLRARRAAAGARVRRRPGRVEVIPHGAFDYLTRQQDEVPLPEELAAVEGPVILAFGLIRPYKGTDVLLEAFARVEGAELWIVGMPRMPMEPLRELAERAPGRVRFIDRFVTDPEIPAFMRRADVVVLPYRNIEQSGVLYTALAFGRPLVLSDVGGFPEVAGPGRRAAGAARGRRGARGGPARAARRPGRARAPRGRGARRRARATTPGTRSAARTAAPLRAAACAIIPCMIGARDRLLGARVGADRLRARRLPAAAWAARPRCSARRRPAAAPTGDGPAERRR